MSATPEIIDIAGALEALDYLSSAKDYDSLLANAGEFAMHIGEVIDPKKVVTTVVLAGTLVTGIALQPSAAGAAERPAAIVAPTSTIQPNLTTVTAGDSLWRLVDTHTNLPDAQIPHAIEEVKAINHLGEHPVIHPGNQLNIDFLNQPAAPIPTQVEADHYIVKPGDTLWGISLRSGIPVDKLQADNGIPNRNVILPGQDLVLNKAVAPAPVQATTESIAPAPAGDFVSWPFQKGQNIITFIGLVARTDQIDTTTAFNWIKQQNPQIQDYANIPPGTALKLPGITHEKWAVIWDGVIRLSNIQKLRDAEAQQARIASQSTDQAPVVAVATAVPAEQVQIGYNTTSNVLSKSGLNADQLNRIVANTAMHDLGPVFKQIEDQYGVNALFAISHAGIESSWGTSQIARTKNNLFGRNAYDSSPMASALSSNNYGASVLEYGKFLHDYYLVPTGRWWSGGTSIANVFVHYSTAGIVEARSIANIMNQQLAKVGH